MNSMPPIADIDLRRASLCQLLHWLATGRVRPEAWPTSTSRPSSRLDPQLNCYVDDVRARNSRNRRSWPIGVDVWRVIGRLDGIPLAVTQDTLDMAGWPTRAGLPGRRKPVENDAHVVARLRASGAVVIGKTDMDEGALGAATDNPHFGATHNPHRHGYSAGGSSGGAAAAVAAGLAVAAVGSDSLGFDPHPGQLLRYLRLEAHPRRNLAVAWCRPRAGWTRWACWRAASRISPSCCRCWPVTMPTDARSRRRRVAFALPDWDPGHLRAGLLPDLAAVGVQPEVIEVFEAALARLPHALGDRRTVDFADWNFARTRRAGLLLMEAEMLGTFAGDLADDAKYPVSDRFRSMLGYAASKSAADYAMADRVLDAATLKMRRLVAQRPTCRLRPTTPQGAFPLGGPVPDSVADLTSFASLAAARR
ncbi:Amidase OS=Rhodanobacter lindaniclasticus OX=75310 GN=B1991_04750 PE=3 SV=1 [Rhodanobacter lindaniclasticus]